MIKLIIFDYDGVIVDSFANIHDVYKIMCTKLGKSCPEDVKEFRRVYGYNSSECYSNLGFSEEEKVKAEGIFKEEILKKEPKLFEGIIETLRELHKNYKLVVISSSHKEEVDQKLEKFHILEFFDDVIARENFI